MLSLNLQRLAMLHNIPNLQKHLTQNGFSPNIAHRIASNADSHIKFQYLEKLCLLFKCTPNDMLEWRPDNNVNPNEPLKQLTHKNGKNLSNLSGSVSIEEYAKNQQQNKSTL